MKLVEFHIDALTGGSEAEGICGVVVESKEGLRTAGLGKDGDIVIASLKAFLKALNRLEALKEKGEELKAKNLTLP